MVRGKLIRVWMAFGLSTIISIVVVFHSATYLIEIFEEASFLIILALALIEVGYVVLPYVASWNREVRSFRLWIFSFRWDGVLVAILFFLSVVPATLQTVNGFTHDIEARIIEAPAQPDPPTQLPGFNAQIKAIDLQIESNLETIRLYQEQNFLTRSQKVADKNIKLSTDKGKLLSNVTRLEQEHLARVRAHAREMQEFTVMERKAEFNSFFDILKILWALMLISVLQLVNGRFVFHGTTIMNQPDIVPDEKDENLINKQELLNANDLLRKVKVTGIGIQTVERFITVFDIWDERTLVEFATDKTQLARIEKFFPKETSKRLKRLCGVIQRKLTDEMEE